MRAFQVLTVTLAATAARGQIISGYGSGYGGYGSGYGGYGLGIGGLSYGASYAPSVSYGSYATPVSSYASLRSPVAYSTGSVISSAPAVSVAAAPVVSVAAAPAVSYAAAPAVSYAAAPAVSYAAAPAVSYGVGGGLAYGGGGLAYGGGGLAYGGGSGGAIVTGSGGGVRSHEIHTGGAGNTIRVEEIKAGGQVIRVHDSPRLGAEVLNVQGPAAAGNHIRLISRSGPTQVQRSVVQDPNVQVFDIVNPPQPGDRIINIRKAPAPPAQVELVAEQHHGVPEIHVGGDEANIQVQHVGGGGLGGASLSTAVLGASNVAGASYAAAPIASYAAAPIATRVATVSAAPIATRVATVSAAPIASYAVAAPAVRTISAAPAVSYSTGLRTIAAPAIGGISYGSSLGGLSYGLGGSSYGLGGSSYGLGGLSYGLGGTSYGLGGSSYGLGGNSYGTTTILGKKAKKASS